MEFIDLDFYVFPVDIASDTADDRSGIPCPYTVGGGNVVMEAVILELIIFLKPQMQHLIILIL